MPTRKSTPGTIMLNCSGGLGNQMFHYAAGRYFAKKLERNLEIVKPPPDKQQWNGYPRPFQLDQFCIPEKLRETQLLDQVFFSGNPKVKQLQPVIGRVINARLIAEPAIHKFHPDLQTNSNVKTVYLTGSWQAAGYVQAIDSDLRQIFQLRTPAQKKSQDYADQIRALPCPVSLHVRIGDYSLISHSTGTEPGQKVSQILPARYYERALSALNQAVDNYTLVVFSDDPAGARKLFERENRCIFVEGNDTASAHEDMWLMSLCKHHIIANSTFSWWGAWLNGNTDKRVFAPRYWGNTLDSYFPDICPSGWTIVDNA